jgi:hypothetical protein
MLSYHNFLVKRLNKSIDVIKNVKLATDECNKHTFNIGQLITEIQLSKRSKAWRDVYKNDVLWEDYLIERDRR